MIGDLISRSALLEKAFLLPGAFSSMVSSWDIAHAPAVDAVEVVRCKDCKWFNSVGCAIYIVDESDKPKENDFCSFGERRADDDQA